MKVRYSFKVKGVYEDGVKVVMSGELIDEEGYPHSAFETAVTAAKSMCSVPLNVDLSVGGNVTLLKLKKPVVTVTRSDKQISTINLSS